MTAAQSSEETLASIDEALEDYVEWHGSADAASWAADGSHERGNHNQCEGRIGFGEADRVVTHLQEIAAEAKAGTEHEQHDGWSWPYPVRDLICGCGDVLVYNYPHGPQGRGGAL